MPVVEAYRFVSAGSQTADHAEASVALPPPPRRRLPGPGPWPSGLDAAVELAPPRSPFLLPLEPFAEEHQLLGRRKPEAFRAPVICATSSQVRGYVSCVVGCPYEGPIAPDPSLPSPPRLAEMGLRGSLATP